MTRRLQRNAFFPDCVNSGFGYHIAPNWSFIHCIYIRVAVFVLFLQPSYLNYVWHDFSYHSFWILLSNKGFSSQRLTISLLKFRQPASWSFEVDITHVLVHIVKCYLGFLHYQLAGNSKTARSSAFDPLKLPLTLCLAVFGQLHTIDFFACLCYLLSQGHLHSESSSLSILVFFFHRLESGEIQVDFRVFQRRRLLVFLLQGCIYVFFVLCVIFCLHLNLPLPICCRFRAIARAKNAVSHNYDHKKPNVEKDCSVYLRAAFIRGRRLFEGGVYSNNYGNSNFEKCAKPILFQLSSNFPSVLKLTWRKYYRVFGWLLSSFCRFILKI